jgi:hypothetical protein
MKIWRDEFFYERSISELFINHSNSDIKNNQIVEQNRKKLLNNLKFEENKFLDVGFEHTYGLNLYPKFLYNKKSYIKNGIKTNFDEVIYQELIEKIEDNTRDLMKPIKSKLGVASSDTDENSIEYQTIVFKDKKTALSKFVKLNEFLSDKMDLAPSSIVSMEDEGGCHININLPQYQRISKSDEELLKSEIITYEMTSPSQKLAFYNKSNLRILKENRYKFFKLLNSYLYNNPFIAWYFLSPFDNVSSKVVRDSSKKR